MKTYYRKFYFCNSFDCLALLSHEDTLKGYCSKCGYEDIYSEICKVEESIKMCLKIFPTHTNKLKITTKDGAVYYTEEYSFI